MGLCRGAGAGLGTPGMGIPSISPPLPLPKATACAHQCPKPFPEFPAGFSLPRLWHSLNNAKRAGGAAGSTCLSPSGCHSHRVTCSHIFVPFFSFPSSILAALRAQGRKNRAGNTRIPGYPRSAWRHLRDLELQKPHDFLPTFLRRQNKLEWCGTAEQGEEGKKSEMWGFFRASQTQTGCGYSLNARAR